jgi:hypothetical protein
MRFPALASVPATLVLTAAVTLGFLAAETAPAQTIRVETDPAHAIAFDPDKAMGTSMDILSAKEFETVYSDAVLKESLSAGWGPITYRQNTELTIDAWHWNPNGTWSDAAHRSGYFTGIAARRAAISARTSFRASPTAIPAAIGKAIRI